MTKCRDLSRWILLPVNQYEIPNLEKTKNLKVILNELCSNIMANAVDKNIIITSFIVNNNYSCHPYMFITENLLFKVCSYVFLSSYPGIPCWKLCSLKISGYITEMHLSQKDIQFSQKHIAKYRASSKTKK